MNKRKMGLVLAMLLYTGSATSTPIPQLTEELGKKITKVSLALDEVGSAALPKRAWQFSKFRLRLHFEAAFKLSGVFKLAVVPDIELFVKRTQS